MTGQEAEKLSFYYLRSAQKESVEADTLGAAQAQVRGLGRNISREQKFDPHEGAWCTNCDFQEFCPAKAKTPRPMLVSGRARQLGFDCESGRAVLMDVTNDLRGSSTKQCWLTDIVSANLVMVRSLVMSASLCFAWMYWLLRRPHLSVPSPPQAVRIFQIERRAIRGSLICLVCALCAACSTHPPSTTYVSLDPVYNEEIRQTGMMPVLLFPDDPVEAIYDKSPFLPSSQEAVPYQSSGGLSGLIATAIVDLAANQINSAVDNKRKKEAYQTAMPVIEQLSSYDLKSDVAHALASEMADGRWLKLTAPVAISQKTILDREKQDLEKFDTYPAFLSSILPPDRSEHFYLVVFFKQSVQADYALQVKYQIYSKDHGTVIFRNDANFICPGTSAQDWMSWWSTNDGQRLRTAYTTGVRALAELIAFDLGARNALDDKITVTRADTGQGTLTARCPEEWWK